MLGPSPSLLREKLGVVSSHPSVGHCVRGEVYSKSVSQPFLPFLMWVFSHSQCVGVAQLLSGFLLEGIAPRVAVDFMSMGGGEFRSLL